MSPVLTSTGDTTTFEPAGVAAPSVFVTVHTSTSPYSTATSRLVPAPLTSAMPFLVQLIDVATVVSDVPPAGPLTRWTPGLTFALPAFAVAGGAPDDGASRR